MVEIPSPIVIHVEMTLRHLTPLGNGSAAFLVTLPPGAYTAQVSGAGGDGGIALVEVYEVQ